VVFSPATFFILNNLTACLCSRANVLISSRAAVNGARKKVAVKISTSPSVLEEHVLLRFVELFLSYNARAPIAVLTSLFTSRSQIQHSNILSTVGYSIIPATLSRTNTWQFAGIYDYASQRDLKSYLKTHEYWRCDATIMSRVFDDILSGIEHLHSLPTPLVHMDLKPDNCLLDCVGRVVIADFGLCQQVADGMAIQGTPSYLSPEVVVEWFNKSRTALFTPKIDIFSFGVLVVYCLTGRYPFKRITARLKSGRKLNTTGLMKHFTPSDDLLLRIATIDRRFIRMVRACLQMRPEDRPTATALRAMLRADS
jgi:serine/threonine protein kinase